jgi:protein-S-isoprenylcysteine O-methyltransferase Ste14
MWTAFFGGVAFTGLLLFVIGSFALTVEEKELRKKEEQEDLK